MTERKTMTIYAEPTRHEVIRWAESALRNSSIDHIDEDLISDFKDGLSALAVAMGQLVPAQTWQPIETAPKDGTEILYRRRNGRIGQGVWYDNPFGNPNTVIDPMSGRWCSPTHWMPLPAAPAPEAAE